jgi:hypothetical protein
MDITRDDIAAAARRIAGDVRRTPLLRIAGRDLGVACAELWLKLEHLQVSGSFKARGMFNRMRANAVPAAGVVIASGGNAGIAVAHAARTLGVRAEVFVPESSSEAKRARLAQLGAVVTVRGASYADALAASLERQRATGALLMHAYDQREVVEGAGTLAAEVEADAGVADRALVSVGGGGLISGVAAWFAGRSRVEALEPALRRRSRRRSPPAARSTSTFPVSLPIRSARAGSARSRGRSRSATSRRRTCSPTTRSAPRSVHSGASCASRSSRRRRCRSPRWRRTPSTCAPTRRSCS